MSWCKRLSLVVAASALGVACSMAGESATELPGEPGLCFTAGDAAEQTCLDPETLSFTRTEASGHDWFRVRGALPLTWVDAEGRDVVEEREVTVFGQVAQANALPTGAEQTFVSIPVVGRCTSERLVNIFGRCDVLTLETICDASVYADVTRSRLIVDRLEDASATGRFEAELAVSVPAACCQNDPACPDEIVPVFDVAAPLPVEGWFHVGGTR